MQSEGPYRFTEPLAGCQVGRVWAALDGQDRPVTVVVLEDAAAGDQAWREAFANAATMLANTPGGHRYIDADFAAASPWVAYAIEEEGAALHLFQTLGMDYQPIAPGDTEAPALTQPSSGPPQMAWSPQPWSMTAQPISGAPLSPAPLSPAPLSPASVPVSAQPVLAVDPFADQRRRITPVDRPPRRSRVWLQVVVALVLLVAGGAIGFGWGNAQGGATAKPSPSPSLPIYEATQFSINKAKFDGALAQLAEPWLTRMGGCAADTDTGGPDLPPDEQRHVFCRYGGVSVHFALYESTAKEDAARAYRGQLSLTGTALAPGLREATRTKGGFTAAPGSYVEYAFKSGDGRPMCGIWWDRDDSVGAFYIETLCEAGIAGNWDALRDLWRRNS